MSERTTVKNRSEKSAKAVVAKWQAAEAEHHGEGLNEKDSHETCRLAVQCIRSPGNGAHGGGAW